MGQDLRCICGHNLPPGEFENLPALIKEFTVRNADALAAAGLIASVSKASQEWKWRDSADGRLPWNEWHEHKMLSLKFPAEQLLSVTLGQHAFEFSCWVRWVIFLQDTELRNILRPVFLDMGKTFGSEFVLYLPDNDCPVAEHAINGIYDGKSLLEIERGAIDEIGLPLDLMAEMDPQILRQDLQTLRCRCYKDL